MADDEMRLDAGGAAALASLHRQAASALDGAAGDRPSGDLGEGGDEIEAIASRLGGAAESIAGNHEALARHVEYVGQGFHVVDERARDRFGPSGRGG